MSSDIRKITIADGEYPKQLKNISDPPEIIYVRGELLPKEQRLAVVGTRLCSPYGKQVATEITGDLAEAGLTIVSGLAPGIDTFTHKAALERGGRTIAVVGTGIDEKSIYPKENIPLARKIIETGGTIISELPPGTPGSKITFPKRNRIISGLSLGVLVVEAKERSGALITAGYAIRQERKLFAVPGSVYSSNSKGPHSLIKKGAVLVETAEDILRELKLKKRLKKRNSSPWENGEEKLILEALAEGALDIEKIIERTKLPAATVASTIALLEMRGAIKNLGRNVYSS